VNDLERRTGSEFGIDRGISLEDLAWTSQKYLALHPWRYEGIDEIIQCTEIPGPIEKHLYREKQASVGQVTERCL
jgi:hypothetical protein